MKVIDGGTLATQEWVVKTLRDVFAQLHPGDDYPVTAQYVDLAIAAIPCTKFGGPPTIEELARGHASDRPMPYEVIDQVNDLLRKVSRSRKAMILEGVVPNAVLVHPDEPGAKYVRELLGVPVILSNGATVGEPVAMFRAGRWKE